MKTYHVVLQVRIGEYEKATHHLITGAADEGEAIDAAIIAEAHDPEHLEWTDNGAYDLGGEMHYSAARVKYAAYDFAVLSQYLYPNSASILLPLKGGSDD